MRRPCNSDSLAAEIAETQRLLPVQFQWHEAEAKTHPYLTTINHYGQSSETVEQINGSCHTQWKRRFLTSHLLQCKQHMHAQIMTIKTR